MAQGDLAPVVIGAGVLLLLAKWGIENIPNIPNPLPPIGRGITKGAEEATGGIRKDRDETWDQWWGEFDVPFSDKRIPLFPGLVRDRGRIYTTGGPMDPGGQMADIPWTAMDIVEPDQSAGSFLAELDLPGLPPYDLRDAPGDVWRGTFGRLF